MPSFDFSRIRYLYLEADTVARIAKVTSNTTLKVYYINKYREGAFAVAFGKVYKFSNSTVNTSEIVFYTDEEYIYVKIKNGTQALINPIYRTSNEIIEPIKVDTSGLELTPIEVL